MSIDEKYYTPKAIRSESDFLHYRAMLPKGPSRASWIFRGQRCQPNNPGEIFLMPSLERNVRSFYSGADLEKEIQHMRCIECWSLREFMRRLHHYTQEIPQDGDKLEWLALMQHYGAPTRLLDWTYSFYVAAFFAAESSPGCDSEVWALNADFFGARAALDSKYDEIVGKAEKKLKERSDTRDRAYVLQGEILDHLWENPTPCVCAVNPFRLNERLAVQQGVFLFPGDLRVSFEENLTAEEYRPNSKENLITFSIAAELRKEILKWLHPLNINYETLFPGLDGFARSFATRVGFHPDASSVLHCKSAIDNSPIVNCCEIRTL